MHVTPLPSPRMAKSTSLGVLDHETEMHIVDQDDINGLTQDVKNFSDGLARLKGLFTEQCVSGSDEDLKVLAHERLGDVLCTLKSVLQRYPPLNTTELFSAAGTLIGKIKTFDYEEHENGEGLEGAFSDAIDQLALEFSNSVSEYLMGDLQHTFGEEVKTKSYDNLLSVSHDTTDKDDTEEEEPVVRLTADQIDGTLMKLQAGLELAFQRAKAWSKYLKDVMGYIERRAQLEVEYSKNLSRLAAAVKPALTEEGFLPLQSVYCTVLSQDVEYSKTCQATFTLLQTTKFVEPLTTRRNDHDKVRKTLKDTWNKEVKKMQESVNNLRKSQSLYVTRQQEYEKAKELSQKTETDALQHSSSASNLAKVDKKRKAEEDACHKAAETETTYKACVAEANSRQTDIQKTKADLLAQIREQIFLSDQIIKKVTIDYFQLLQTVSAPVPVQYNTLCEASKRYESGSQYGEFVRRLPVSTSATMHYEEFKFEPYNTKTGATDLTNRKTSTHSNESASSDHHSGEGSPSPRRDKYRVPLAAWSGGRGIVSNSDTDSQSGSSKSLDSSPSNSPYPAGSKKMVLTGSMDDLIEDEQDVSMGVKQMLAVPGTEQLDVQNLYQRQGRRRNTTFGVSFQEQVEHYHSAIPPIISKCLKEVEKRGITVKGIYRVSGVKSTVENLCQKFENDPESVSLDAENPNVISNVLKLYLRQLPDPLLTFKLYPNFIQTAKENMSGGMDMDYTVEKLHDLIDKLPFSNRKTCGVLMHHLKRVASFVEQNQMNASNLGIVFGPTLLRPQGGNASLACLVDTPHQTRVVELLIVNAENLFGPIEDHQLIPGETMVEPMDQKSTLRVPQLATIELPKDAPVVRPEIKKEPSPTISLKGKDEELLTSHLPSSSGSPREQQSQKSEDMILPGSAGFDKKDASSTHASEGDENEDETGLVSSDESDIQSDDDLLLPDDSHHSQHALQHDNQSNVRGGALITMTPPLTSRRGSKPLPSPASSPNLSIRSAVSAPPTIRIENSVPDLSNPQDTPSTDSSAIQQRVLQLPPVNTWVPKGESIFNSILDSRSPQVYRRTNISTNKTASFPQSTQTQNTTQGSRVSWPQRSQSHQPQISPPTTRHVTSERPSQPIDPEKSPKLLRKCTSFDLERSKPFPARALISSPMLLKKGISVDEGESAIGQLQTPKMSKWTTSTALESDNKKKIIHQEEDELMTESAELNVPQCGTGNAAVSQKDTIVDSIAGKNAIQYLVMSSACEFDIAKINESLEDPNIPETAILNDIVAECEQMNEDKSEKDAISTERLAKQQETENECSYGSTPELGAKPKTHKTKKSSSITENINRKFVKSKSSSQTKQTSKSPSGSSSGKSEKENAAQGKIKSKSSTSTVKTALLSSAAKLKAMSRKSPVMLLSYKSHSISIPDHSEKPERPVSTSDLCPDLTQRRPSYIHQTESSPTVLVTVETPSKPQTSKADKTEPTLRTASKASVKSENVKTSSVHSKTKPVSHESKKNTRPCESPSTVGSKRPSVSSSEKKGINDKHTAKITSDKDKTTKSAIAKTQTSEKHGHKSSTPPKASAGSRSVSESSVSHGSKKVATTKSKPVKKESLPKDNRPKSRLANKRDSISSVNSDSSKKSDHFHDCCHVRRKPEKK